MKRGRTGATGTGARTARRVATVRDVLKDVVRTWKLEPAEYLAVIRKAWPEIVGGDIARSSVPMSIRAGKLRVQVDHGAIAQEIRLRHREIQRETAGRLGSHVVKRVIPVVRRTGTKE